MTHTPKDHRLYIVVSQTGTALSLLLRLITGARYNHSSVSLDPTMDTLYSFGRKNPYNFLLGAFVKESPHTGTFQRFRNTEVHVLELAITREQYQRIQTRLDAMWSQRSRYGYNYRGLFLGLFRRNRKDPYRFYCSEFVAAMLETGGVVPPGTFGPVVKPIDFLSLPNCRSVYLGKLREYRAA